MVRTTMQGPSQNLPNVTQSTGVNIHEICLSNYSSKKYKYCMCFLEKYSASSQGLLRARHVVNDTGVSDFGTKLTEQKFPLRFRQQPSRSLYEYRGVCFIRKETHCNKRVDICMWQYGLSGCPWASK